MSKFKFLTSVLFLVAGSQAMANTQLESGDISLRPITGQVVSVEAQTPKRCPEGAVCESVTIVNLSFTLTGCANRLGDVRYETTYSAADDMYDVYVSGTEIVNEMSSRAKCVAPPVRTAKITIANSWIAADALRVHFLTGSAAL